MIYLNPDHLGAIKNCAFFYFIINFQILFFLFLYAPAFLCCFQFDVNVMRFLSVNHNS
jgi:hypothetical protein